MPDKQIIMPKSENLKSIICIADHDEDDRILLHDALVSLGIPFDIIEIISWGDLVNQLSQRSDIFPDIIFLNTCLPGIEEVHYIEEIRKEAVSGREVKVIVYSSQSDQALIEKAFEVGADFYAVKPSNYRDIKNLTRNIMEMDWEITKREARIFHMF